MRALKELKVNIGEIKKEVETIRIERDELTKTRYFGHWTLSRQISPQRVVLNLVSRTKEDAIRELVQAVSTSNKIDLAVSVAPDSTFPWLWLYHFAM